MKKLLLILFFLTALSGVVLAGIYGTGVDIGVGAEGGGGGTPPAPQKILWATGGDTILWATGGDTIVW